MNEIEIFKHDKLGELRVTGTAENPMFCLSDVCKSLELGNVTALKSRLDEKGVNQIKVLTNGGYQQMFFVNEPNLYRCIFRSDKEKAKEFQDWVFNEVLPSIRKTGGYMVAKQDDTPELIMARALQVAQDTINRHKQQLDLANERIALQDTQLKQQAPKVKYVDNVLQSVNTYTTTQMSKELGLREAKQLYNDLKEHGYMFKQSGQWLLTAKYSEKGYTKSRTYQFTRNDGSIGTSSTTVWTEKGRHWLHELQSNNKI